MHLGLHCHHCVCCSDGLVLVVGWDVLVLMCQGDCYDFDTKEVLTVK
jgi:hypothetical protein